MDKLQRLANILTSKDSKRFKDYLESPFFKVQENTSRFWKKWYLIHLKNPSKAMDKEKVWSRVFPGKEFNDSRWRKLKSVVTRHLEEYLRLVYEDQRSEGRKELSLLKELNLRGDKWLVEAGVKRYQGIVQKEEASSEEDLYFRLKGQEEIYLIERENGGLKSSQKGAEQLAEIDASLDTLYCFEKLKNYNGILNRKLMDQAPIEPSINEAWSSLVPALLRSRNPLLRLHALWFTFRKDLSPESHSTFESELLELAHLLSLSEQKPLFIYAINYRMREYISTPIREVAKRILTLYKVVVMNGVVLDRMGRLSTDHYKNICTLARASEDIEYLEEFTINSKSLVVNSIDSKDTLSYCDAILAFEKGQLHSARELLSQVNPDGYLKIHSRVLMAKILWAEKDYDQLERHLENSIKFISRTDLPRHRRSFEKERFRLMLAILKLGPEDGRKRRELVDMITGKPYHDAEWFLSILEKK